MHAMVVIPTYNERENITLLVERIVALEADIQIVIVDDNSPDGTGAIADQLAARLPGVHVIHRPSKQGLGTAYMTGFGYALRAGAEYIFEMDADSSHDPACLPEFLALMDRYDVVIGSRYCKGLAVVNWSLRRLALSLAANLYARRMTGLPLSDCTSGFKCFRRAVLEQIDLSQVYSNGYAFQVEMNYRAQRLGFRLGETPIIFYDRHSGKSKMSTKIAREAFWHIFKMRVGSVVRPVRFAPRSAALGIGADPQQIESGLGD